MRKFFLIFIFGFIVGNIYSEYSERISFEKWNQMKFRDVRILIANNEKFSSQGFAGATLKEMTKTIIIFPNIPENVIFTNKDQGFGPVNYDIKIYYLDRNFNILKWEIMKKKEGFSIPPKGTFLAVEGLP